MLDLTKQQIVKRGICTYASSQLYEIIIVESQYRYGSGDYEDPSFIRDDQREQCFYTWFDTPSNRGAFCACGGVFSSIEEAIESIEKESYFSKWKI